MYKNFKFYYEYNGKRAWKFGIDLKKQNLFFYRYKR